MVDTNDMTDDERQTTDDGQRSMPGVLHKLPTCDLKMFHCREFRQEFLRFPHEIGKWTECHLFIRPPMNLRLNITG